MADDDLERPPLIDVLARRQAGPLSPPMAQTVLLPLHELDPGVFERVVVELAWRVENARNVQLYGRRGQKQYGLDVVGTDRSGHRFVYQARRLGTLTPSGIRQAVVDYAGPPRTRELLEHSPPRRFEAKRFVLATSAQLDVDTALVDELERLRAEYRGDLEVDVYGAEKISHALRDAVGVVAGIFGPEWAKRSAGWSHRPLSLASQPRTACLRIPSPIWGWPRSTCAHSSSAPSNHSRQRRSSRNSPRDSRRLAIRGTPTYTAAATRWRCALRANRPARLTSCGRKALATSSAARPGSMTRSRSSLRRSRTSCRRQRPHG
jgi:hypothetical protein